MTQQSPCEGIKSEFGEELAQVTLYRVNQEIEGVISGRMKIRMK